MSGRRNAASPAAGSSTAVPPSACGPGAAATRPLTRTARRQALVRGRRLGAQCARRARVRPRQRPGPRRVSGADGHRSVAAFRHPGRLRGGRRRRNVTSHPARASRSSHEVASAVGVPALPGGSFVTGQALSVGGGAHHGRGVPVGRTRAPTAQAARPPPGDCRYVAGASHTLTSVRPPSRHPDHTPVPARGGWLPRRDEAGPARPAPSPALRHARGTHANHRGTPPERTAGFSSLPSGAAVTLRRGGDTPRGPRSKRFRHPVEGVTTYVYILIISQAGHIT